MENTVLDYLVQEISNGSFDPNEPLPSEYYLATRFFVSRVVVRKAYSKLEEMGLLHSYQGKGRFLAKQTEPILLETIRSKSFTTKMKEAGHRLSNKNILSQQAKYSRKIWNKLGIKQDEKAYQVGRLRIIDNEPVALHLSYVSMTKFPDIEIEGPAIKSMFSYFQQKGYTNLDDPESILYATLPTTEEQRLLNCLPLVPLLVNESNTVTNGEFVIQFSRIIYRSDRIKHLN